MKFSFLFKNRIRVAQTLLFLLFFGASSCSKESAQLTMDEKTFINVLLDIHFAESALNTVYGKVKDSLATQYYKQIYTIHEVDSMKIQEQFLIMKRNPILMEAIYDTLMNKVAEKEVALKKK